MLTKLLLCPVAQCLREFPSNKELKDHINEHLRCQCVPPFPSPFELNYTQCLHGIRTAGSAAHSAIDVT